MKKFLLTALLVPMALGCMAAVREIPVGRTVDIRGVENIKVSSSVKVHYTQGAASTVLVKENGPVSSKVRVDGNTLYIKLPALDDADKNSSRSVGSNVIILNGKSYDVHTEVYVTLPYLRNVSNSCSLEFVADKAIDTAKGRMKLHNSGSMRADIPTITATAGSSVDVNNSGSFQLTVGKIAAETMSLTNSGSLQVDIKSIAADGDVTLHNSGSLRGSVKNVAANAYDFSNSGAVELSDMAVTAPTLSYSNSGSDQQGSTLHAVTNQCRVSNSGAMTHDFDVASTEGSHDAQLYFNNNGAATSNIKFHGDDATIRVDGSSTVNAQVDCSTVSTNLNGVGKVTLSGRADELTIIGNEDLVDADALTCSNTIRTAAKSSRKSQRSRVSDEPNQFNP